jgi:hypothetical protein
LSAFVMRRAPSDDLLRPQIFSVQLPLPITAVSGPSAASVSRSRGSAGPSYCVQGPGSLARRRLSVHSARSSGGSEPVRARQQPMQPPRRAQNVVQAIAFRSHGTHASTGRRTSAWIASPLMLHDPPFMQGPHATGLLLLQIRVCAQCTQSKRIKKVHPAQ